MSMHLQSLTAAAINEQRLWTRHLTLGEVGATPKGGVNRQVFSPEDGRARQLMVQWARESGFAVSTDAIGNLCRGPAAPGGAGNPSRRLEEHGTPRCFCPGGGHGPAAVPSWRRTYGEHDAR